MEANQKQKDRLFDNRLRKIENRLRKIEILFLKQVGGDKKITKEIENLEREEKIIEKEQKVLEDEEKLILQEMRKMEDEEKWNFEVRYNCKLKMMDANNVVLCDKTKKQCDHRLCPLWKKK
jgi:hypothetical protein